MRCKQLWLAALLSLAMAVSVFAQDKEGTNATDLQSHAQAAFAAYKSKDYLEAANHFSIVAAAGVNVANNYYNAACSYSLAGDVDAAIEVLALAIDGGYANYTNMSGDTDLDSLRNDARFDALLDRISENRIVITDDVKHSADEAEFVFEDAHNFIRAMELVEGGADLVATLEREYFAKASPGLNQLVVKYPFDAEGLAQAIKKHPGDYRRIPHIVRSLEGRVPALRKAFREYLIFAPDIVLPPTYFLVDRHRGIGSGSPEGQLISIERRTDESIGRIETLLIHELTHFQQLRGAGSDEFYAVFGPKKSLLALTIREGTAEFVADRITGRMTQEDTRAYISRNEEAIWRLFQEQMLDSETANWMWSKPTDPDRPRDLAYGLGARIVKAYYENALDKRQAMQEIFAVVDYMGFLEKSRYGEHFAKK